MKTKSKNYLFNYLTLMVALIFSFFFLWFYLDPGRQQNAFTYIGLFLMVPSIILFTIARIQLGASFQVSAEANKLVKTGIYKKVRHPIYLFGLLFLLGIILIAQMFPLILILAIIIALQIKRINNEEKVLTEKFGNEYLEYKKQTWF
jgi:protein-S-isoprenylcysteine O-methyltransferase Ste14